MCRHAYIGNGRQAHTWHAWRMLQAPAASPGARTPGGHESTASEQRALAIVSSDEHHQSPMHVQLSPPVNEISDFHQLLPPTP